MKTTSMRVATQQSRADARRTQIVAAGKVCFRQHGFHGASMADIARQAGMSVGQIYRYFLNKEAIIEAIVETIVAERLAWIDTTGGSFDLAALLAQRTLATAEAPLTDDTALLIEASAEAARNPAVAKIVKAADKQLRERAAAMVKQDYPHWENRDIAARVEIMAVLAEGTALRTINNQATDMATLEALYRAMIGVLLPPTASVHPTGATPAAGLPPKKTANTSRSRKID